MIPTAARIGTWLRGWRTPPPETSRVVVGSTGSGKSEGELVHLVRLADRGDCAVVLLDGHGPLAFAAAGHWASRGHEGRLVYEPLGATDRVLCWDMLPRSAAADPLRRALDDAETRDDLAQCFMAQRGLSTLADRPWTKEWLDAALALGLSQPDHVPLPSLLAAFRPGGQDYERLLSACSQPEVVAKFRQLEGLHRKNAVQYETLTGAARRLLEQVCDSEVVRLRARPGAFDWDAALSQAKLVAFDGGGVRSRELKRTLFLLASMHVIHAVRRHYAATRSPLPVVLVLEEAGALDLVTPFVLTALQELRKAGLSIHVLTQSSLDFGDRSAFEAVLSNAPWQGWYQVLTPSDQELGAKTLTNAAFNPMAVHFTRPRVLWSGQRHTARRILDRYFKAPQLQEQEYRTRLATLRVGERLVRDRHGVRRERVRMLRTDSDFDVRTRRVIERIRRGPLYLPPHPVPPPTTDATHLPDAAERLLRDSAEGDAGP